MKAQKILMAAALFSFAAAGNALANKNWNFTTSILDGFAEIGNPQILPQEDHRRRIIGESARRNLQVVVCEEAGDMLAHGYEHVVQLGLEIVEF